MRLPSYRTKIPFSPDPSSIHLPLETFRDRSPDRYGIHSLTTNGLHLYDRPMSTKILE